MKLGKEGRTDAIEYLHLLPLGNNRKTAGNIKGFSKKKRRMMSRY